MIDEQSETYIAEKNNVKKTLELFAVTKKSTKRKIVNKDKMVFNKYCQYCNPIIYNKKKNTLGFLPSFTLKEMRMCLMTHDWPNLQRLLLLLIQLPNNKETLIWRYALIILLHSPLSTEVHLEEFFKLCICQNDNHHFVLEQLIGLIN